MNITTTIKSKKRQFSLQKSSPVFGHLWYPWVVFGNIPKEPGIVGKWPKIP